MKKTFQQWILWACILGVIAGCDYSSQQGGSEAVLSNIRMSSESSMDFDANMAKVLKEYNTPSLQGSVIKKDADGWWTNAWSQAYGTSRDGVKATRRTIYPICSITKTFIAVAILKLVEDGDLGLDDDINAVLFPDRTDKNNADPNKRPVILNPKDSEVPVTIRDLLHHTSGLADWDDKSMKTNYSPVSPYSKSPEWELKTLGNLDDVINYFYPNQSLNSAAWLQSSVISRPSKIDPSTGKVPYTKNDVVSTYHASGERWSYSNVGYILLGFAIEARARDGQGLPYRSWKHYVKEKILDPLEMNDTRFYWNDYDWSYELARGYEELQYKMLFNGALVSNGYAISLLGAMYTAGGSAGIMKSNADDMAKFHSMILNGGTCQYKYKGTDGRMHYISEQILTSQSINDMRSDEIFNEKYNYDENGYPDTSRLLNLTEVLPGSGWITTSGFLRFTHFNMGWVKMNFGGYYWNSEWNNDPEKNVNWDALNAKGIYRTIYSKKKLPGSDELQDWGGLDVEGYQGDLPNYHSSMIRVDVGRDNDTSNDIGYIFFVNSNNPYTHNEPRDQSMMQYSTSKRFTYTPALFENEPDFVTIDENNRPFADMADSKFQPYWCVEKGSSDDSKIQSNFLLNGVLRHDMLGQFGELEYLMIKKGASLIQ